MRAGRRAGDFPVPVSRWHGGSGDALASRTCLTGDAAFPAPVRGCPSRRSRRVPAVPRARGRRAAGAGARAGAVRSSPPPAAVAGQRAARHGARVRRPGAARRAGHGHARLRRAAPAACSRAWYCPASASRSRAASSRACRSRGRRLQPAGRGPARPRQHEPRRGALTGPVAFRPCRLSGPGGLRGLPVSAGPGGLSISVSTSDRLGQLPARLRGRLTTRGGPRLRRPPGRDERPPPLPAPQACPAQPRRHAPRR